MFNKDGSLTIVFFGIKNDSDRSGFEVRLPCTTNDRIDPVQCLHVYMQKTRCYRPTPDNAVFLTLKAPFRGIQAATVREILKRSLHEAGLSDYTPRSFRCSGATAAIASQCDPGTTRQIGRWKSDSVFYEPHCGQGVF